MQRNKQYPPTSPPSIPPTPLTPQVTKEDIELLFSKIGRVNSVRMAEAGSAVLEYVAHHTPPCDCLRVCVCPPTSPFVPLRMADPESAMSALSLHTTTYQGQRLTVTRAATLVPRTLAITAGDDTAGNVSYRESLMKLSQVFALPVLLFLPPCHITTAHNRRTWRGSRRDSTASPSVARGGGAGAARATARARRRSGSATTAGGTAAATATGGTGTTTGATATATGGTVTVTGATAASVAREGCQRRPRDALFPTTGDGGGADGTRHHDTVPNTSDPTKQKRKKNTHKKKGKEK